MNELRTTNWLLLWIGLMVFNKFYPETAKTYWYYGIAALAIGPSTHSSSRGDATKPRGS
jgi:hypothetical protein